VIPAFRVSYVYMHLNTSWPQAETPPQSIDLIQSPAAGDISKPLFWRIPGWPGNCL